MTKISRSKNRHTFQKNNYINRQSVKGEEVNQDYLKMFDNVLEQERHKFDSEETRKNSLEYDLLTTDWILKKVRESETYAQNLYAAMCNVEWRKRSLWQELSESNWSCSWRYAGGIIADMREEGDYIDWYCSGIKGGDIAPSDEHYEKNNFIPEGIVTEEIENDLNELGWRPIY